MSTGTDENNFISGRSLLKSAVDLLIKNLDVEEKEFQRP
jgi:hypothetical protein